MLIEFPEAVSEISNFYVNKGERITRGLKLAEMKALTGNLNSNKDWFEQKVSLRGLQAMIENLNGGFYNV
ncbi:hypothetical protein [Lactiplantibacillus plantarum]|uniref:hypothetical protein n=1 Tax=Lactiplantibacillus plantarum TaxID=1590 RepID=UPI000940C575|nr:hypothetical protein [Lactiplantibacillus plantarum]MBC6383121.1 hypothetical protein [Lactiplantibacillus plantarum]